MPSTRASAVPVSSWVPSPRRLLVGVAVSVLGPLVLAALLVPARDQVEGAVFGLALILPTAVGAARSFRD